MDSNIISKININGTVYDIQDNNTVTSINGKTGAIGASDIASVLTAADYKLTDTDTNTTYSFAGGTNKFTVTPSGGSAQTVTVTPSIANNVTKSADLTNNQIVLGSAAATVKGSGTSIETTLSSTSDSAIPTSKAVATYVSSQMTSALTYKGTIGSSGATVSTLPATHKVGDVYVVKTAGTYAGKAVEVGDYIICNTAGSTANDAHWDVINGENQVQNSNATLSWGAQSTIATVDGTSITVTMPANPNTTPVTSVAGNTGAVTTAQIATALTNSGYKLTDNDTWTAASTSAAGYVPAATKGKFLHSNASTGALEWVDDNNTTYTLGGLMGSSAKGSATQPIYWTGSAFANTTYTLGKSVPSDAVFTDTKPTVSYDSSTRTLTFGNFA